ncbi:MAG: hypothetical protein JW748_13345 [Anaerolineales bacterium]|nr:hypothetical protein [Anaerolineales bacterium]
MAISNVTILIPAQFTDAESTALANSLKKQGLVVLGKNRLCVAVKKNEKLIRAIATSKVVVKDLWLEKLPEKRAKALPEEVKRLAIFWNVFCDQGDKGVEQAAVSRTLKRAQLAVRNDRIYDLAAKKFVGSKIVRKSGKKSVGNWTLTQLWNWFPIPIFGPFGIPIGHYAFINLTGKASVACDYLEGKIQGPHHYNYLKLKKVKSVSVAASGFIPFWEVVNQVVLTSKGSYQGITKSIRTTLTV